MCSPNIHIILLLKEKNDSQGGSQVGTQGGILSARSFDLARPGLAPPLPMRTEGGPKMQFCA